MAVIGSSTEGGCQNPGAGQRKHPWVRVAEATPGAGRRKHAPERCSQSAARMRSLRPFPRSESASPFLDLVALPAASRSASTWATKRSARPGHVVAEGVWGGPNPQGG